MKKTQKSAQNFCRLSNNRLWSRIFQAPFSEKNYLILGYLITGFDCTCPIFKIFELIYSIFDNLYLEKWFCLNTCRFSIKSNSSKESSDRRERLTGLATDIDITGDK